MLQSYNKRTENVHWACQQEVTADEDGGVVGMSLVSVGGGLGEK